MQYEGSRAAPAASPPQFGSSTLIKREEEDPSSPNYVGILRRRNNGRYDLRNVPNVRQELDNAKAADLAYERDIDTLKRHIVALRRECDSVTRERDSAVAVSATYQTEGHLVPALQRTCDKLTRERDAALASAATSEKDKSLLRSLLRMYQATNGDTEATIKAYKDEKDEIEAHVKQYNPEIIERQEELLVNPEMPQGLHALPPNPSLTLDNSDPMVRMRQGLAQLGVRRGPSTSHNLSGPQRLSQFRQWLESRPLLSSALIGAPTNASTVFKCANLPALPMPASRSCKAPPLFVGQLHRWNTNSKEIGLVLCPDYTYASSPTYGGRVWSRADQWRACGEQEREVFYQHAGEVHYAGTYVCHTGPGRLDVREVSRMGTTEEMVTRLESVTAAGKVPQEDRNAILALYRAGELTANVLGLERVGFNDTLYSYLRTAYEKQQEAARVTKAEAKALRKANQKTKKKTKKQIKEIVAQKRAERAAAKAVKAARQALPQHPMPLPVPPAPVLSQHPMPLPVPPAPVLRQHPMPLPVLPAPVLPPSFGFEPTYPSAPVYGGSHQAPQTSLYGAGAGRLYAPLPASAAVRPPSPPRIDPSELEYIDDEYEEDEYDEDGYDEDEYGDDANPLKREREDDEYLSDDEPEYKVARLQDVEDEDRYVYAGTRGWSEEWGFEPYMGFKDYED